VAAWAVTPAAVARRDVSYQRGFPLAVDPGGSPVDRGHLIPHLSGGEFGPNIFRQDRALNRGWSDEGNVGRIAGSPSTGPGRQGGDHDVVYVGMRKAMRAAVVLEGGDHPALGLDRREPAEARVLQELERRIVS